MLVLCCAISLVLLAPNSQAQGDEDEQKASKVKAAYLINFVKFVQWPEALAPATLKKANICFTGPNPFPALDSIQANSSGDIQYVISTDVGGADIGNCHVLYVNRGTESAYVSMAERARNASVLTVGESDEFADTSGIIEMKTVQKTVGLFSSGKLNLRINLSHAKDSGLRINAQLLEIAAEVIK